MAKKSPVCETGWHSTGTLKVLPTIHQIAERLDENPDVLMHAFQEEKYGGWWSYDAVWMVGDTRVRGRLNIHNQHPNDPKDSAKSGLDPWSYDAASNPMSGFFHTYAKADSPWQPGWPSPLQIFLDRKLKPGYAKLAYGKPNLVHPGSVSSLSGLLTAMAELPWLATVLIHDELDLHALASSVRYETPLISRLPASLHGRVLDVRIMGESGLRQTNSVLKRFGTTLPHGGAAILLNTERRKGLGKADLCFPMDGRSFAHGGDIAPLTDSLCKLLLDQVMSVDEDAMQELDEGWTLLTEVEQARAEADAMDAAANRIEELEGMVDTLRQALKESQEFIEKFKGSGEALLEEAHRAMAGEQEARAELKRVKGELNRLLVMVRDSDLGKAMAAREAAEAEAEVADELLDEQAQELNAARQEITRLQRELARTGAAATIPAQRAHETIPNTWEDLFVWASGLEHVVVGDVENEVDKLRGQTQERTWINQTYRALRALEGYAQMKKERGGEEVPHFGAYLKDPQAEHAIPWTKYTANESKGVMMNTKFVAARTLRVPEDVDPDGKVVMEAHIRIGSGKPPAPRLHFHDDTSGATGKIYIGHIGPHLPNYQTN